MAKTPFEIREELLALLEAHLLGNPDTDNAAMNNPHQSNHRGKTPMEHEYNGQDIINLQIELFDHELIQRGKCFLLKRGKDHIGRDQGVRGQEFFARKMSKSISEKPFWTLQEALAYYLD
jgi:hypothetical protein